MSGNEVLARLHQVHPGLQACPSFFSRLTSRRKAQCLPYVAAHLLTCRNRSGGEDLPVVRPALDQSTLESEAENLRGRLEALREPETPQSGKDAVRDQFGKARTPPERAPP